MSGGAYDYAWLRVNDFIEEFQKNLGDNPLRVAFLAHMKDVANAMRDIEKVDSCDCSEGYEAEAIKKCLKAMPIDAAMRERLHAMGKNLLNL